MTHLYKRSLLLALLIITTNSVTASYKNMLMAASATIATGVATNYLYNYLCKQADKRAITYGVQSHKETQTFAQNLLSDYAYEMDILAQPVGDTQNSAILDQLHTRIESLYADKPYYHYVARLEYNIDRMHKYLNFFRWAKTDLAERSTSATTSNRYTCHEQELLTAQYADLINDINGLEVVLQKRIDDLSIIHSHAISFKQYAVEYQQAHIEELEKKLELERLNRRWSYPYYKPYYTKPCVVVKKITPAPKTVTVTITTTPSQVEPITFDPHVWCDRTDPFNS